jgi:hypothetical protein
MLISKCRAKYDIFFRKGSKVGLDNSAGTVTCYGLDGPGIKSRCGAIFSTPAQTSPEAHPASCTMGTASFLGVKRAGCAVDHHPI